MKITDLLALVLGGLIIGLMAFLIIRVRSLDVHAGSETPKMIEMQPPKS